MTETVKSGTGSAVDQTIDHIRALIRTRGLGVGDVLPSEIDLAAMFGASRNTVREAIRSLKAFGIVESRQKVGAVLTDRRQAAVMDVFSFAIELSGESFRDVQGFRRLIEVNLFDQLDGRLNLSERNRLGRIIDDMAASPDAASAARLDYDFHMGLVRLAANRTLGEIYDMLKPVMLNVMETGKSLRRALDETANEHRAILDALIARDRIAYAYHVSHHLDAGLHYIPAARGGRADDRKGTDL